MGASFLQDDKGNYSHTRLCTVAVFFTLCLAYLIVTAANVLNHGTTAVTMVDIPVGVISVIGIVWAGSDIRKAIENKGTPPAAG